MIEDDASFTSPTESSALIPSHCFPSLCSLSIISIETSNKFKIYNLRHRAIALLYYLYQICVIRGKAIGKEQIDFH